MFVGVLFYLLFHYLVYLVVSVYAFVNTSLSVWGCLDYSEYECGF